MMKQINLTELDGPTKPFLMVPTSMSRSLIFTLCDEFDTSANPISNNRNPNAEPP